MNWLLRTFLIAGFVLGCQWPASNAAAQTGPLEGSPNATLVNTNFQLGVNLQSLRGVPLSTTAGTPIGSDGRAPTVAAQSAQQLTTVAPTPLQFQGFVTFAGLPVAASSNLDTNLSFIANAQNLNWPVGLSNGSVAVVMRSALVGAPYVIQQSFLFIGSIVGVPNTDETGHLFGPGTVPEDYWLAEPFTTNNHASDPFYWSPNAQAVFAIQPGQMAVTWKKAQPYTIATLPPDYSTNQSSYVTNAGFVYRLYTVHYLVSGAAAKPPQTIFWTEGSFQSLGQPVSVPPARVSEVNIVYNNNFPQRVTTAYVDPDQTPVVAGSTNSLQETRTLWFDSTRGQILAYNIEGRVFVELLGELNSDGVTRRYLGYEVVDVVKEAPPVDVTINLGDRVTAYQDGRDDSALYPAPLLTSGQSFYYQQSTPGSDQLTLYATRETSNLNDFLSYWLDVGVAGLQWPLLLDRYHLVWPADVSKYSQYLRPQVDTDAEAALTAVQLPNQNAPSIAYQDPLDQPRGKLTDTFAYYTFLVPQYPAHRALLQFVSGNAVSFERVFSWLDTAVKSPASFAGSVATNLTGWDPTNLVFNFGPNAFVAPYIVNQMVNVGDRITAPPGELGGAGTNYWAGYINETNGNAYNPGAYINPFVSGFTLANQGAIIPVNASPENNVLEVWWFRSDNADGSLGFMPTYWPAAIGRYTLQWPTNASQIIMANNAGSGVLSNLQAQGTIYYQNDPTQPGYNPNEEHALILSGTVYALRDDLNITTDTNHEYSSDPFVLLDYTESDGRPAMELFKVRREAPEQGVLFDYIVEAGTLLQAPMPLPLLNPPVEGSGANAINYNTEPSANSGDDPVGWNPAVNGNGPYSYYQQFTFQDRNNEFWVYRGLHAGLPSLQAGSYDPVNNVFDALPDATAVVGSNFEYYVQVSRRLNSLTMSVTPALPSGLSILGTAIMGVPNSPGSNTFTIIIEDTGDFTFTTNTLSLNVVTNGTVVAQGPLSITSTNQYSGATVTYVGRPPNLAQPPMPTNSFTMRFYYKTEPGFAWPGVQNPPTNGSIVPFLRPYDGMGNFVGDPTAKTTASLDIVYRPVWPASPPTLFSGDTLTVAKNGIAAVRGQTSVQLLYQQSIGEDINDAPFSAVLEDPTRQKVSDISAYGLTALPPSVMTDSYQGKIYFPNLPPHLANRFYFDPNLGTNGSLVLIGQFVDDVVGEKYLLLNVLRDADLAAVENLCPTSDTVNYPLWKSAVDGLSASVQTFYENPLVPGQYIPNPALTVARGVGDLVEVDSSDTAVDSYAISASGPGIGYITYITGNGRAFTPVGDPITVYILRTTPPLTTGELKVIPDANPLNEMLTMQHTPDLGGRYSDYYYDWRISPPAADGSVPLPPYENWTTATNGTGIPRYTLGGAGVQALSDNYLVVRYRSINPLANPANTNWSAWTDPQLAPGWIKRVLAGINPFDQRVTDLFDNSVDTDVSIISQAGPRWEGDIALNLDTINNFGLIEIYETVLRRGESLSINSGINYGPANQALLLAASYLNDLYMDLGNAAAADAADPTISIGTDDPTFGDTATALFSFMGEVDSLLAQDLALLEGRDDVLQPGVTLPPVYNRLYWNYTLGINSGEVIYALNYNIQDENNDGVVNAADAAILYPQGHGDAYGHYLTALGEYYGLLMNTNFDWVPRIEAIPVLGATISVNYEDERKFAASAAALARTGEQIFDLTWKQDYQPGTNSWSEFGETLVNTLRPYSNAGVTNYVTRYWGLDHWAVRTGLGTYMNWVLGNAIVPAIDNDPTHEGIQKVDRTTIPELKELPATATALQQDMDNAEGRLNPLGLSPGAIPFDINPAQVVGATPETHFEQIYDRAVGALNNAVVSFNDAKSVKDDMRSQQNSLADFEASYNQQELAYTNQLIELYGTPYPDDIGPGQTYVTGYAGPDLVHYMYVDDPDSVIGDTLSSDPTTNQTFQVDVTQFPADWQTVLYTNINFVTNSSSPNYTNYVSFVLGPNGFMGKPSNWTSERQSPGSIQQSISDYIRAYDALEGALSDAVSAKQSLDQAIQLFQAQVQVHNSESNIAYEQLVAQTTMQSAQFASDVFDKITQDTKTVAQQTASVFADALPQSLIFGLADGGDELAPARAAIMAAGNITSDSFDALDFAQFFVVQGLSYATTVAAEWQQFQQVQPMDWTLQMQQSVNTLGSMLGNVQGQLTTINQKARDLSDAKQKYQGLVAQGDRIQQQRETFREHAAAIIQGYRTVDAGLLIFQNEKLERYTTLFKLASEYAFLAAQAYDYDTGLLNTPQGQSFLQQIISSQALGVVIDGTPQYAGSDTGDPGLSSALAEMKADWDVLKGRLGFNNPDGYGTTVSLRTENLRILPGSDGDNNWKDVLQQGQVPDLLADSDVKRYCEQIDDGSGDPVPGIILTFSTTIADGLNLFGQPLATGDHSFSSSSFATKIFAVGVDLDGYIGMDNPPGTAATNDPTADPNALAATPYVYLIPVGVDSMRSPPLGDTSTIRTWSVDDVAIPLPFNISASDFSTQQNFTSADSLTEPLFAIRKHEAFRPVSTTDAFNLNVYGADGQLQRTSFTNSRLIGRSVWNSKWKLVIPGRTLLNDPNQGLSRFIQTVKDVKLYFVTYSYSGN